MAFSGWPTEAMGVLTKLQGDPTEAERNAVRADREHLVRAPMSELVAALAQRDPAYADHAVWRYAKGLRAWQVQGAAIRMEPFVEIGLGFDLDGLSIRGMWWYGPAEPRVRYRAAVAGRPGVRLQRILAALRDSGYEIGGDAMVRVPRGYPPDHPRADLLRMRSLSAGTHLDPEEGLHSADCLPRIEAVLTELRPMLEWLGDHVSTPTS